MAPVPVTCDARVAALEAVFRDVASTRMHGVPVLNPRLQVQAVGFELTTEAAPCLFGVLVTPWFMNLVRLPLQAMMALPPTDGAWLPIGSKTLRAYGDVSLEFIGSFEAGLGVFEASSLFSPMFEFADQAAAVATADEVLKTLRAPQQRPTAPARRGFLLGRSAARAGA